MIGTLLNERYRLDVELGRGGTGIVFRGHDILLDRDVAVKVLSAGSIGSEGRVRLLNEAQAAAKLNHPNIVAVYDAGEDHGLAFIVMELLEGRSLYEARPTDLEEIVSIARQICTALEHAHTHGVIHRDLKPENVIIGLDGSAKLTDFGLARSVASRMTDEGTIIGTVFYLPPEQALGKPVDGRTDLYALGVMMYELAAGQLPFTSDEPLAVISQHLHAPVVPPSSYNASIPPALDALIVRLLSKQPEDRPASAAALRRELEMLGPSFALGQQPAFSQSRLSPLDQLVRGRLVRREAEVTAARELWKEASSASGERRVLLICGESGVGKTPLVREIRALAEVSGGRAFTGECFEGGEAPYAPIGQILREAISVSGLALPEYVQADLIRLAPDLQARSPELQPNPSLDPKAEQQRLFESFVSLCAALAEKDPLLLVIEDIQWADGGSLALLRYLARRSRTSRLRLLILLTYQEEDLDPAQPLNELLLDLTRERLAERIKLSRFDREGTRRFMNVMLEEQVTDDLLEAIYRETDGNQFFIEELCKALIEQGKLYRQGGRWRWTSMDEVQLPQSVRLAVLSRVGKLPPTSQDLLRLAAVIGREFDLDTLQMASEQDEDTLIDTLEAAERAQLIAEVRTKTSQAHKNGRLRYTFAHGLITSALRESVSGLRRYRLHRRVAAAIEQLRPDDYEALAYHYNQARDEEHARIYYLHAAVRAQSLYANEEAIHFYSEALALMPPEDPQRFDTLARRACVYDIMARREEQLADARELVALSEVEKDDARRCDALIALADVYLASEPLLAREPAEKAASLARTLNDPGREGRALRRMGWGAYEGFDTYQSRVYLEAAVERFRQAQLPGETAACLSMLALVLSYLAELPAAEKAVEEAVALNRATGDRRQEAINLRRMATTCMHQDLYEKALPYAQAALTLHQELGDRAEECHAENVLGLIFSNLDCRNQDCRNLDQYERAKEHYCRSLEIAETVGLPIGITNAATNLTWIYYFYRGEYEAGLSFLEDRLRKINPERDEYLFRTFQSHRASLLENLGQYEQALKIKQDIFPITARLFSPSNQVADQAYIGYLQAHTGQFEQAQATLKQALQQAREIPNPIDQFDPLFDLGAIALLQPDNSDLHQAQETIQEAIRLAGDIKDARTSALWIAGELYLLTGEPEQARLCLAEAVQRVERSLNPVPWERYFFAYAKALRATGDEAGAQRYLRCAYDRIMLVSSQTRDETLRRSWFERVPANHQILAAWSNQQASPGGVIA